MKDKNGVRWVRFENLASTNEYVKNWTEDGDVVVLANAQSEGRGTKGRSFVSEKGGVYLSLLRRYENFPSRDAFKIMASTSTAVCKTLASLGLKPVIKWPNDVHVNGKKICGILIENTFSGSNISRSVIGVGLNVNNPLTDELKEIATTVFWETGKQFSVDDVAKSLIYNVYAPFSMDEYLSFVGYMGGFADLIIGDKRVHGRLIRVDETGGLICEIEGKESRFTALEISVRV